MPDILVVDDDPDHRDLIVLALEAICRPETIATASDAPEALAAVLRAADLGALPKLVILDLNLARGSGLSVLRALRADARTARLPVVMHSSSAEEKDVAEALASGASGYLRKSGGFAELCTAMQDLYTVWVRPPAAPPAA